MNRKKFVDVEEIKRHIISTWSSLEMLVPEEMTKPVARFMVSFRMNSLTHMAKKVELCAFEEDPRNPGHVREHRWWLTPAPASLIRLLRNKPFSSEDINKPHFYDCLAVDMPGLDTTND